MQADFAEVGPADFSEICLLVSVAGQARAKIPIQFIGLRRSREAALDSLRPFALATGSRWY